MMPPQTFLRHLSRKEGTGGVTSHNLVPRHFITAVSTPDLDLRPWHCLPCTESPLPRFTPETALQMIYLQTPCSAGGLAA